MKFFENLSKNTKQTHREEMTFFDHLEDLRWVILRSLVAVLVLSVVAFIFKNIVFDLVILSPKDPQFITNRLMCIAAHQFNIRGLCIEGMNFKLINFNMAGQFMTHITISLVAGFIVAFPYITWEIWRFVRPALYDVEKQGTRKFVFWVTFLFFLGVLMGYFIISPISIVFLSTYQVSDQVVNTISLSSYIGFVTSIWFATGITFELPVVTYFLTKLGIVTPHFMRRYRKIAVVVILFLAAIITPSPDMFSQSLVAIPLYLLYEASIYVSRSVIRKREYES
jgi:sec-independent protein translocase protein TatC